MHNSSDYASSSQEIIDYTTNYTGAGNIITPLVSSIWKDIIKGVGQNFPTSDDLRIKLQKYAIAQKFNYKFERNNTSYIKVKCDVDGCPWMLRASKLKNTKEFYIYKFENKHVHVAGDEFISHFRTSKKFVASVVEERVRGASGYKPIQITKDFSNDFGVKLGYMQAWRGKELSLEEIHGSSVDSYRRLPWYCEKIKETNPGSVAFVVIENDRFKQCFIAFQASIQGFLEGCRPLLFIDGTFLKAKFKGVLLSAQACDASNGMYPVAFAIVAGETFKDWNWFLKNLKDALNTEREIIIVSDRNANIIRAVSEDFGHDLHAYCFRHLEQNVLENIRGNYLSKVMKDTLKKALWSAACARLLPDFMQAMETIKAISPEAHKYLEDNSPEHWAVLKFPRRRYDQMTSNMAETFNNWILEARELPIYSLIDTIRIQMLTRISKRQAIQWKATVGLKIDEKMKVRLARSSGLSYYQSSSSEYEVRGGEISHLVNLQHRYCSCLDWYHSGLPCIHACLVLKGLKLDPYAYVDPFYTRQAYDHTYKFCIRPIQTWDRQFTVDDAPVEEVANIQPPLTRVRSGRRKKQRIESQEIPRRVVHCSRCHQQGHYRNSCTHAIG